MDRRPLSWKLSQAWPLPLACTISSVARSWRASRAPTRGGGTPASMLLPVAQAHPGDSAHQAPVSTEGQMTLTAGCRPAALGGAPSPRAAVLSCQGPGQAGRGRGCRASQQQRVTGQGQNPPLQPRPLTPAAWLLSRPPGGPPRGRLGKAGLGGRGPVSPTGPRGTDSGWHTAAQIPTHTPCSRHCDHPRFREQHSEAQRGPVTGPPEPQSGGAFALRPQGAV